MNKDKILDNISKLAMVEFAESEDNAIFYRSQSSQLVAFASIAIAYGVRTNWLPTENVSADTRKELANLSGLFKVSPTAHQTFIVYIRRLILKICTNYSESREFQEIKFANNEKEAIVALLSFMRSKNIFAAAHMRLWVQKENLDPVDLTRKTGDAAKFGKNQRKICATVIDE